MENENYYQVHQTQVSGTVSFLIGVKRVYLEEIGFSEELLDDLAKNETAVIIRSLCNIRSNLMLGYAQTERSLVFDMRNLDSQSTYQEDVKILKEHEVNIIKANYRVNKYIADINKLISEKIEGVRSLFPEWVNREYIKSLFIMPKGQNEDNIKSESNKFIHSQQFYPFKRYINWNPTDVGNLLYNDKKFLKVLYEQNGDAFYDDSKVYDASESVKANIYDFISDSNSVVMAVDCENSDPYKLASVLRQMEQNELEKISKILLYDDIHTTEAWSFLDKITNIPVEHNLIERIKEDKSLVDVKMAMGISKAFYSDNVDSFILLSSDSDFWGVISSLPNAYFLVMIEDEKCGIDIKNALMENNIYYCSIDDFCTGNINDLKRAVLLDELRRRTQDLFSLNANELVEDIFRACRMNASDAEKKNFLDKYVKHLSIAIDNDGNIVLRIPE